MKNFWKKEEADEYKKDVYGLTWITIEMAEQLGLVNKNAHMVAYPKAYIHAIMRGKVKVEVNEF